MKLKLIIIAEFLILIVVIMFIFQRISKGYSKFGNTESYREIQNRIAQLNSSYALHPYLGFVLDHGSDPNSNILGFNGPEFMPGKDNNDFNVGIFGGSVAGLYYEYEKDNLIYELKKMGVNKDINVYSFALGGYKQPQQLMTLQYLLVLGYKFNLIINIDGFNESTLPYLENYSSNVSSFYPRGWNLYSTGFFDKNLMSLVNKISRLKSVKIFFDGLPLNVGFGPSKITTNLINLYQLRINRRVAEIGQSYQSRGPESYLYGSEEKIKESIVDTWFNSSLQMANLSKINGIPYLEILQPNQYLSDRKDFSSEELANYVILDGYYSSVTRELYPRILERVPDLKKQGVPVYDLTNIFMNVENTIYSDNCCHYNTLGLSIMNRNISDIIKSENILQ